MRRSEWVNAGLGMLVFVFLISLPARAQEPGTDAEAVRPASFRGTVRDRTGSPVTAVPVGVVCVTFSCEPSRLVTDALGSFVFDLDLPPGRPVYMLWVEAIEPGTATSPTVTDLEPGALTERTILLKPAASSPPPTVRRAKRPGHPGESFGFPTTSRFIRGEAPLTRAVSRSAFAETARSSGTATKRHGCRWAYSNT